MLILSQARKLYVELWDKYVTPKEKEARTVVERITKKFAISAKEDVGFAEFPRPGVSKADFKKIVKATEEEMKKISYTNYDVFETTVVVDFDGEKKAWEEYERQICKKCPT